MAGLVLTRTERPMDVVTRAGARCKLIRILITCRKIDQACFLCSLRDALLCLSDRRDRGLSFMRDWLFFGGK